MQPDHDRYIGLRRELLVLGKSQNKTLEDLVGDCDPSLPQDQPEVEAGGLGRRHARTEVLDERVLKNKKSLDFFVTE